MKERLIAPPRSAVPVPGSGSVFGRGFFGNLRAAGGGGCFLLFFMSIGAGLFLFGLAGTFGPYKDGLRENGDPRFFLAAMAFGSVFFLVALRMLQLALTSARNERRVRGDAKEPWTWDHPWSTEWMKPDYTGTGAGTFLGRVAFLALLAVFNVAWTSDIGVFKVIVGVFDLLGLLVLYDSIQKVLTWIRVRQPVVIWSRVPTFLGGPLEGRVAFARRVSARGPAKLTLRRVEDEWVESRSSNGSGSTRALEPFTVYQQEQEVALSGEADVIDFAFDLPANQPGTDLAREEAVYWQLQVIVPVLGPDIEAVFLAPVYRKR